MFCINEDRLCGTQSGGHSSRTDGCQSLHDAHFTPEASGNRPEVSMRWSNSDLGNG